MRLKLCFVLLLVLTTSTLGLGSNVNVNTWKMNVPRVLLPLTEEGASFKLFSKGGCFTWKSSRPEVGIVLNFQFFTIYSKHFVKQVFELQIPLSKHLSNYFNFQLILTLK
jgi:hypothetical protein